MLRLSITRFFVALSLLLTPVAWGRDLAVIEDYTGLHTVYGADTAGYHREVVPMQPVRTVEVRGGLATLSDGVTTLLYGMTEKGIVFRRVDWDLGGPVEELVLGDRLAVARSSQQGAIFALVADQIVIRVIPEYLRKIQVAGGLAYVETSQGARLYAPTSRGVTSLRLPDGRPRHIETTRNQAFIDWGSALFLYTATDEEIYSLRIDKYGLRPRRVYIRDASFQFQASNSSE